MYKIWRKTFNHLSLAFYSQTHTVDTNTYIFADTYQDSKTHTFTHTCTYTIIYTDVYRAEITKYRHGRTD
uniref:Uncharacterized protein n=1 Tax=Octopus bimaculoides TaxID=37653 RepID=A0A0L8IAN8_OCTBM